MTAVGNDFKLGLLFGVLNPGIENVLSEVTMCQCAKLEHLLEVLTCVDIVAGRCLRPSCGCGGQCGIGIHFHVVHEGMMSMIFVLMPGMC